MINLFILVIIDQFEQDTKLEKNILQEFDENIDKFRNIWADFSGDTNGRKIKHTQIIPFFKQLEPPLGTLMIFNNIILYAGFGDEDTRQIAAQVMKMKLIG